MNKAEMRTAMTRLLRGLPAAGLAPRSARAAGLFAATRPWRDTGVVLCFLSMPHELDTTPLITAAREEGKAVAVPVIEAGEIRFVVMAADPAGLPRDRWGIPVPDPSWPTLDLARARRPLVAAPGLAFDRSGNRLGRGKGYYDRFLARARAEAPVAAIGICFSEQLVPEVPHGDHDQPLDGVITDAEAILRGVPA